MNKIVINIIESFALLASYLFNCVFLLQPANRENVFMNFCEAYQAEEIPRKKI